MAVWYFVDSLVHDNTDARITRTKVLISALDQAYKAYMADNGALPKDLDDRRLSDALSGFGAGKYYMALTSRDVDASRELVDAWGTPLRVTRQSQTNVKIESAGPDKKFGTADDITNRNL